MAASIACMAIAGWGAAPAGASQSIESFSALPSSSQAGGHPDLAISLALDPNSQEAAESATIDAPAGLVLLPALAPTCSSADFAQAECGPGTQIGVATIRGEHESDSNLLLGSAAIYSLEPDAGQLGRLGLWIPTLDMPVTAAIRVPSAAGFGFRLSVGGLPQAAPLAAASLKLWGVPASGSNDTERLPGGIAGCPAMATATCATPTAVSISPTPFVESPTKCDGLPQFVATLRTYEDPIQPSFKTTPYPQTTGCNHLVFNPDFELPGPGMAVWAKSGFDLSLTAPQEISPATPTAFPLWRAVVAIQGGIELDEEELDNQQTCTAAQAGLGAEGPATCPAASQIGTATIGGPLYGGTVAATIYLGESENDAHEAFIVSSAAGVDLKLRILLETTVGAGYTILDTLLLPQLPIDQLDLHFSGGESAPFQTTGRCGDFPAEALMLHWDTELNVQRIEKVLKLNEGLGGGPCPGPATNIRVTLEPSTVLADGRAVTTAVAEVTDNAGIPVLEDEVLFNSDDPGERIGPVFEFDDGSYGAEITASTSAGLATITATDVSISPAVAGSASLTQLGPSAGPSLLPAPAIPVTTIVKHSPKRSAKRAVTFMFTVSVPGSTFRCKLDARPFRPCVSPVKLTNLRPGKHRFTVFATSATGVIGEPADYGFTISRKHRRR